VGYKSRLIRRGYTRFQSGIYCGRYLGCPLLRSLGYRDGICLLRRGIGACSLSGRVPYLYVVPLVRRYCFLPLVLLILERTWGPSKGPTEFWLLATVR
jgi:hypothetical protein